MSDENQKKKKQHDCEWKKWIDEVYRPWFEQQQSTTEDNEDEDEGGNPSGPPPPPPPGP